MEWALYFSDRPNFTLLHVRLSLKVIVLVKNYFFKPSKKVTLKIVFTTKLKLKFTFLSSTKYPIRQEATWVEGSRGTWKCLEIKRWADETKEAIEN